MPTEFDSLNAVGIAEAVVMCGEPCTVVKITGQTNSTYDVVNDTPGGTTTNYNVNGVVSTYSEQGQTTDATGRFFSITIDVSTLPGGIVITDADSLIYKSHLYAIDHVFDAGLPAFVTLRLVGT